MKTVKFNFNILLLIWNIFIQQLSVAQWLRAGKLTGPGYYPFISASHHDLCIWNLGFWNWDFGFGI